MKAMYYTGYGTPDKLVLGDVSMPEPSASQLWVKVTASSVNPIDWKLHDGQLRWIVPRTFPAIPGLDVVGEVIKVGSGELSFKTGDRVMTMLTPKMPGASAEFCLADAANTVHLPAAINDLEAAGLPLAGLTAIQGLCKLGRLQAGQRVLIVGASGGVGHFAVPIAKALNASVVAVCGRDNVEWVRHLGADEVVDYTTTTRFGADASFDLIFDCVSRLGHREIQTLLKPSGIYVDTLFKPELILRSLVQPLHTAQRYKILLVQPNAEGLSRLLNLYQNGQIKTHIDTVFDLEQLADAHRRSQTGRTRGKIVIQVSGQHHVAG